MEEGVRGRAGDRRGERRMLGEARGLVAGVAVQ